MVQLAIPDKLSIATYLISYYNYFKDMQPAPLKKTKIDNEENVKPVLTKIGSPERPRKQPGAPLKSTQPTSTTSPTKPALGKTVSSPLLPPVKTVRQQQQQQQHEMAVSKVSSAISALQKKENLPSNNIPSKSPFISSKSVDDSPVSGGVGVRGRKTKFTPSKQEIEEPVAMDTGDSGKLGVNNERPLKVDSNDIVKWFGLFTFVFLILLTWYIIY